MDDLASILHSQLKEFVDQILFGSFKASTVTIVIKQAMKFVMVHEKMKKLSGSEKKDLVISVSTKLIMEIVEKDATLTEDDKSTIEMALSFAPILIDSVVDFAKTYSSQHKGFCCF